MLSKKELPGEIPSHLCCLVGQSSGKKGNFLPSHSQGGAFAVEEAVLGFSIGGYTASWKIYVSTAGGTLVTKNVAVGQALISCPESGVLAVCDYCSTHLQRAFSSSAF